MPLSSDVALLGGNSTKPGSSYYAPIKAVLSLEPERLETANRTILPEEVMRTCPPVPLVFRFFAMLLKPVEAEGNGTVEVTIPPRVALYMSVQTWCTCSNSRARKPRPRPSNAAVRFRNAILQRNNQSGVADIVCALVIRVLVFWLDGPSFTSI